MNTYGVKRVSIEGDSLVVEVNNADISRVVIRSEKVIDIKNGAYTSTLSSSGESRSGWGSRNCG